MLPSNMVLAMGKTTGFNNKILVSDQGFKIGVNRLINKEASKEVFIRVSKTTLTAPKAASTVKLPHGERVLSKQHQDEMITLSVLLITTSLVFFYFFK